MSLFSDGLRSIRKAGWAPVAVIGLHQVCIKTGWRASTDWLLHFLGGAAIAYFLYHAISCFRSSLGTLTHAGHILFTLCAAATVALCWDLSEFASDQVLGTDIQHSLQETMFDLSFGLGGAGITCLILLIAISMRS